MSKSYNIVANGWSRLKAYIQGHFYASFPSLDPRIEEDWIDRGRASIFERSFMAIAIIYLEKKPVGEMGGGGREEIEGAGALSGRGPLARNNKQWEKWMGC